ncbi:zinc-binding dehydrogenase [Burkholderia gladioli]|uniref:Alcohol dehydrogenase GroES domain protein n=2 Tax=Burkholderia gladioli TaxID=28095 RepID=F2LN67_BURGS|nr:zinc-binding dehydrogenase [Burkholderia gladioli]AEA64030.1 Alcohol dehydrogenase GroES domain protein [Burkholderia gladioli BSR3]
MTQVPTSALELRSLITSQGQLRLWLETAPVPAPADDEILVRIEAAPVNPFDILGLLGPADIATLARDAAAQPPVTTADVPAELLASAAARHDLPLSLGNEGAGIVVAAGDRARHLLGRAVALRSPLGAYAQYRAVAAAEVLVLPEGTAPEAGASALINPMTALSMLETMRVEGHTALIHTAAASNLGQMLVKICAADGVPLVNVVRNASQVALLRELGAQYVLDSGAADFDSALVEAIEATGATLAFDAIGGGDMAERLLTAMGVVTTRRMTRYDRYGSSTHRQVYLYGTLDPSPTILTRRSGLAWGVGGWLLTWRLRQFGEAAAARMRERIVAELDTTFASRYGERITLAQLVEPETIRRYARRATGEKFLVEPNRGA